ncbi:MAG: hypothetical protein EHM19_12665 [Candidatus Latescibacterota bacterium]|nr:MAG: hypothetical protein EHM19_12665 [Candidatus Latescibacterota bacterium]
MSFNKVANDAVEHGVAAEDLFGLGVVEEISRARYIPESDIAELDAIAARIEAQVRGLVEQRSGAEDTAQ